VAAAARHAKAGLGMTGSGSHTVNEAVELPSLQKQAKRAALLIRALTR